MKPMPKEIAERWSPMWGEGAHPERPWWRVASLTTRTAAGPFVTWRRCDGRSISEPWSPIAEWWGSPDQFGEVVHAAAVAAVDEAIVRLDAAHPLPAPPPMPGQVWVYPSGSEMLLQYVVPAKAGKVHGECYGTFEEAMFIGVGTKNAWPPPGAVLVFGPTPWGINTPWSPA